MQFTAIDFVKELLVRLTSSNKFLKAGYVAVLLRSKCVLQIISMHVFLITEKCAHSDIPPVGQKTAQGWLRVNESSIPCCPIEQFWVEDEKECVTETKSTVFVVQIAHVICTHEYIW